MIVGIAYILISHLLFPPLLKYSVEDECWLKQPYIRTMWGMWAGPTVHFRKKFSVRAQDKHHKPRRLRLQS